MSFGDGLLQNSVIKCHMAMSMEAWPMIMEGRLGSTVCKAILKCEKRDESSLSSVEYRVVFQDRPESRHPRVPHLLVLALVQMAAPNKNLQPPLRELELGLGSSLIGLYHSLGISFL